MDIVNSEGPILALRESVDKDGDMENERLYVMGTCLKHTYRIYTKINEFALEFFFQGRISIKELFLLRVDEPYVMETIVPAPGKPKQSLVYYDDAFYNRVLSNIDCGNDHYHTLPEGMKLPSPLTEELPKLRNYYINSFSAVPADRMIGKKWIDENL